MEDLMRDLLIALRQYDTTKMAHDEAMGKCEVSWGYHGYNYITALEKAENEFATALEAVIDSRINEALKKYGLVVFKE